MCNPVIVSKSLAQLEGGGQIDFCPLPWQIAPPPPYLT